MSRKDPAQMSKDELLAEVYRLDRVIGRWKANWHTIINANKEAYEEEIIRLKEHVRLLEGLL